MDARRQGYEPRSSPRRFAVEGEPWEVHEVDARDVPGAQGLACLIFESVDRIRRVWFFPPNWYELNDAALWRLCDRSVSENAQVDSVSHKLASAILRAMENMNTAQVLLDDARAVVAENRALRTEQLALLQQCRAERDRMRAAVELHTRELQEVGVVAEDALFIVANAVREGAASVSSAAVNLDQLRRDAKRWCASAYRAA
jgi:hypothetical protein